MSKKKFFDKKRELALKKNLKKRKNLIQNRRLDNGCLSDKWIKKMAKAKK